MRSDREPPRVVVDTSLCISGLLWKRGAPFRLLEKVRLRAVQLVVTRNLRAEYERVLRRPKFAEKYGLTEQEADEFLRVFDQISHTVQPAPTSLRVRDPKDQIVLEAAIGGRAAYLVTGDADLLDLDGHVSLGDLRIVTATQFLDSLDAEC